MCIRDSLAHRRHSLRCDLYQIEPGFFCSAHGHLNGHNALLPVSYTHLDVYKRQVRVYQTHRAQRAEPHGIGTPGSHDLNGHTALVLSLIHI